LGTRADALVLLRKWHRLYEQLGPDGMRIISGAHLRANAQIWLRYEHVEHSLPYWSVLHRANNYVAQVISCIAARLHRIDQYGDAARCWLA
jgi:hypothetical protein